MLRWRRCRCLLLVAFCFFGRTHAKTLYDVLHSKPQDDDKKLKAAFRKLALAQHPDKLGPFKDEEEKEAATAAFVRIVLAWETLGDADKRREYDSSGMPSEEDVAAANGSFNYAAAQAAAAAAVRYEEGPFELAALFQRGAFSLKYTGSGVGPAPDVIVLLHLTLEQCLTDHVANVTVTRQVLCPVCQGSGHSGSADSMPICPVCQGTARSWHLYDAAADDPFDSHNERKHTDAPESSSSSSSHHYRQGVHTACSHCNGQGHVSDMKCEHCSGKRVVRDTSVVSVNVPAGAAQSHVLKVVGMGNMHPDRAPGNLKIQLLYGQHEHLTRSGSDLLYTADITLVEALLGFRKEIPLLSSGYLTVTRTDVTFDGYKQTYIGHGLPTMHNAADAEDTEAPMLSHGSLIVTFAVHFPTVLTAEHLAELSSALSPEELAALQNALELLSTGPGSSSSDTSTTTIISTRNDHIFTDVIPIDDNEPHYCSVCPAMHSSGACTSKTSSSSSSSSKCKSSCRSGATHCDSSRKRVCVMDPLAFTWPPRRHPVA